MGNLKALLFVGFLFWFGQFCVRFGYQLNHNSDLFLKQLVLEQLLGEEPAETTEGNSPLEAIERFFN